MNWEDFEDYYEPSEFEQQVEEFKDSLRRSFKQETQELIERLRKENEELREFIEVFDKDFKMGDLVPEYKGMELIDARKLIVEKLKEKYPDDVPNTVCNHAFIRGYSLENSFGPKEGDYNYFCQIGFETLYIWTYQKNVNSALVSETQLAVKELPYWKTAANLIWLSLSFAKCFECATMDNLPDYKWMYYFDPYKNDALYHIKKCYQEIGYVHDNEIIMVQTKTRKYLGI